VADTEVTVTVPDERVGAFHRMFGSWVDDPDLIVVSKDALTAPADSPWGDDVEAEGAVAVLVLKASSAAVVELLATLLDTVGTPVDDRTIAGRCGVSGDGAVPQLLASLAATCHDQGRAVPIRWIKTGDVTQCWLPTKAGPTWRRAFKLRREPPPAPPTTK